MAQISLRVDDDVKRGAEQTLAFILKTIFDTLKESCRM